MGNDNQPKHRQARKLDRKAGTKPTYDRILIVCEGEKTEVNYFKEIIEDQKLPTAHVKITNADGTDPLSIVNFASAHAKNYEKVFAVFDRDQHATYHAALKLKTHVKKIISVSCFEFWLLLHFEEQTQFIHRHKAFSKMKTHIPDYSKGKSGVYAATKANYCKAKKRATLLAGQYSEQSGVDAFTNVYELVDILKDVRKFEGVGCENPPTQPPPSLSLLP